MKIFPMILFALVWTSCFAQTEDSIKSMQDLQYPFSTKKIQLNDSLEIAYIDEGEGEQTLLFIHGLGSYLPAWKKNIDTLRKDYRCIALDLPSYGKSSKGNYSFSLFWFADVIFDFIEKKELENVVLVGHSMGGQIAMTAVLKNSSNVKKLILIAPAGFEKFSAQEALGFQTFITPEIVKNTPPERVKLNYHLNFVKFPEDAQFMLDDRLFMTKTGKEFDAYCNMIPKCVMAMLNEPVAERLSEIKIPTLILFGEKDVLIPNKYMHPSLTTLDVAESGHEKIPNSQLVLIPESGHFVQWERAEKVNEAIHNFLK